MTNVTLSDCVKVDGCSRDPCDLIRVGVKIDVARLLFVDEMTRWVYRCGCKNLRCIDGQIVLDDFACSESPQALKVIGRLSK